MPESWLLPALALLCYVVVGLLVRQAVAERWCSRRSAWGVWLLAPFSALVMLATVLAGGLLLVAGLLADEAGEA